MNAYSLLHFVHVAGALALFAGVGIELVTFPRLRGSFTAEEALPWLRAFGALRRIHPLAGAALLVTGIYLTAVAWGHVWWVAIGFVGMVLLGVLGGAVTGRRIEAIAPSIVGAKGPLPAEIVERLQAPALWYSLWVRTALGVGVVFMMTVKTGLLGSLLALGVSIGVGMAVSALTMGGAPNPDPAR